MQIVLSGYYGFDNVGDEAILLSIITALRKQQPDVSIIVLSNNPASTAKTYNVEAVNRWKMKEVSQAIKSADGLISGGGSLMQDSTGMKSIPYYAGIIRIAKWHKKPVFVYAQGMGPINHPLNKWIVKSTFNKVDGITVRDEDSRQLLETIGVTKKVSIVPDPVIGLDHSSFTSEWLEKLGFGAGDGLSRAGSIDGAGVADAEVPGAGSVDRAGTNEMGMTGATSELESSHATNKPYIAVSVRDWPSTVDFKKKIADSLTLLAQNGQHIVLVPMHGEHDEKTSYEIISLMGENARNASGSIVVSPGDMALEEKIAVIGQSKLLIGMRLHSLIFAATYHTPFIAISYDPKIDAFANIAKQPIIGHVEKDNWSGSQLFNTAEAILSNHASSQAEIGEVVDKIKEEAAATAQLALEIFKQ